jgi:hypothetical protein
MGESDYKQDKNVILERFKFNDIEHDRLDKNNTLEHEKIERMLVDLKNTFDVYSKDYISFKSRLIGYGVVLLSGLTAMFGYLFKKLLD